MSTTQYDGHATPTMAQLYRSILAAPEDDLPRLMYADEAAEYDPARSAFIRAQFRRAEIGAPRTVVELEQPPIGSARGPEYLVFHGSPDDGLAKGQRVDLAKLLWNQPGHHHMKRQPTELIHHGLLIVDVETRDHHAGVTAVTVKRDEGSVPYPFEEAARLDYDVLEHTLKHKPEPPGDRWFTSLATEAGQFLVHAPERPGGNWRDFGTVRCERGFPSIVACEWRFWAEHGDTLSAAWPIVEVQLSGGPDRIIYHDAKNKRYEWRLTSGNNGFVSRDVVIVSESARRQAVDPEGQEERAVRTLLHRRWSTVVRWTWPGAVLPADCGRVK